LIWRRPTLEWVSVGLLAVAGLLALAAWQLQASALSDIERAREVQEAEVPDGETQPPDPDDYAGIVRTLKKSIEIRTDVDKKLSTLESLIRSFDARRKDSEDIADASRSELAVIGRTLGGAAGAADRSVSRVRDLGGKIGTSARLSGLIAEELEELDHSLGPTLELPDLLKAAP
jgi:HAMP domain-containing protein